MMRTERGTKRERECMNLVVFDLEKIFQLFLGKSSTNYNTNLRGNELRKDIVILRKSKEKKGRN
jgi:hypothetical protein